jgi:hypothetical protein
MNFIALSEGTLYVLGVDTRDGWNCYHNAHALKTPQTNFCS